MLKTILDCCKYGIVNRTIFIRCSCANKLPVASMSNWSGSYQNRQKSNNNGYNLNNVSRDRYEDYSNMNQIMSLPPPPPPPTIFNCGELRGFHRGAHVELSGRVARQRMGRFLELRDAHGATQLVATDTNSSIGKRFTNMPLDSMISIHGYVNLRPQNSRNTTIPTGDIEVHVDAIQVNRLGDRSKESRDLYRSQKRNYSTVAAAYATNRAVTSQEYDRIKSKNILSYLENREVTCGELRVEDVGREVTLVGWLDLKKRTGGKFLGLQDGYGHIQVVNKTGDPDLAYVFTGVNETDIILVRGRVMARPAENIISKNETGLIEVFIEDFKILNADEPYTGPVRKKDEIVKVEPKRKQLKSNKVSQSELMGDVNAFTYRTHNCGELREQHIGSDVILCGWLEFQRMQKFLILRDSYGSTQIIIPLELNNKLDIEHIAFETILKCTGKVTARPPGMQNPALPTGAIEVVADSIEILNNSQKNLPIEIREFNRAKDSLRLEYRYLDLRFPDMQHNLRKRSKILMKMREFLINQYEFVEVETPTLFRRTPGGAQEFIVPTRLANHFYSLVQSPQQFKQMLMVGGIDRYFQIARCYRDEATRIDRQPEFTQLDIELSFTDRSHILKLIEELLVHCLEGEVRISTPFPIITYNEAMENYGCDKPDTRFGYKLTNITDCIQHQEENLLPQFEDFASYAIHIKNPLKLPNNFIKQLDQRLITDSRIKFYWSRVKDSLENWQVNGLGKVVGEVGAKSIADKLNLAVNDYVLIVIGSKIDAQSIAGHLRLDLMSYLEENKFETPRKSSEFNFLWVLDFPLVTRNQETDQLETTHHPFTAPHSEDLDDLKGLKNLENVRSLAYDLVLNGSEVGGGSIRIHEANLQKFVLQDILKIDFRHLKHLIEALDSGCPPHGGIALGIDRLMAILCNTPTLRDVIAFPKGFNGRDPLSNAPCEISDVEKKLYHINVRVEDVKKDDKQSN